MKEFSKISYQPYTYYVYLITALSAISGLLFGFDTGVIAGALIFIRQDFEVSTRMQEIIVSAVVCGAFVGALFSGRLADWLGRRILLLLAAIAFVVGTLWVSLTPDVAGLVAGRFLLGLAIGVCSFTAPLFIAEIAPAHLRGSLVLFNIVAITAGQVLAHWVNYILAPQEAWRLMFAVGLLPALVLFVGVICLPETPRWLVAKGQLKKAHKILARMHPPEVIERILSGIQTNVRRPKQNWRAIFAKSMRPVLMIGLLLGIFQQGVGINTVMYYGPTIFAAAGFAQDSTQILATMVMAVINMVGTLIAVCFIDKLGRRRLLIIGSVVAAISLGGVSLAYSGLEASVLRYVALVGLGTYMLGYSVSLGALFWLLISEIFPLRLRGQAMSFVTAVQWLANFVVALTFLTLMEYFGPANTFWLYASVALLCALFCYYFVPETKGVSLEEIEANLHAGKALRELGQPPKKSIAFRLIRNP